MVIIGNHNELWLCFYAGLITLLALAKCNLQSRNETNGDGNDGHSSSSRFYHYELFTLQCQDNQGSVPNEFHDKEILQSKRCSPIIQRHQRYLLVPIVQISRFSPGLLRWAKTRNKFPAHQTEFRYKYKCYARKFYLMKLNFSAPFLRLMLRTFSLINIRMKFSL